MRKALYLTGAVVALLAVSCAKKQIEPSPVSDETDRFYASIETSDDTRAYADESLCVSWVADDRISVFNKLSQNEEYRFTGETGDNSGWFELVPHKGSSEGNKLDYTYAVHPYRETTGIGNDGVLTVALPAEQHFRNGSFGSGMNVMVARTDDNLLQFRNALGYLVLKIYGSGIQVSSVTLKGNDGEILAGNAEVTISPKGVPSMTMLANGGETLTLVCEDPVVPGATPKEATEFWFALPPTTFEKGYTVEITDADGNIFSEILNETVEVPRNQKVLTDPIWLLGDGYNFVSVDNKPVSMLTSVTGGDTSGGSQKWTFYSNEDVRVQISSWPCHCNTQDHIGYHLTLVELDIPGVVSRYIPLIRTNGDEYTATTRSPLANVHLSDYRITEDGTHLDFDLSVNLYRNTGGDIRIRIVYSGPVSPALQNPEETALLPGVFTTSDGRKLRFSKGNLQAVLNNGVITKWQFAENQWDMFGDISKLTDETGVVDKFTHSTTAPLNRWGIHPLLYDMEVNQDYYITNYEIGTYRPQWRNPDLIAEYGDGWALFNLLAVAMTFDHKVEYPRGMYDAYYNANCTGASIDGVEGLVLFPDNYVQPEGIPLERIVQIKYQSSPGSYSLSPALSSDQANAYTAAQWAEMEAAGAVFLPHGTYMSFMYSSGEINYSRFPGGFMRYYTDPFFPGWFLGESSGPEAQDMIRLVKYVDSSIETSEPTGPEVCGPFGGLYLSKGYLTETEDGYTISVNDQLEIIKYYDREDMNALPRHYLKPSSQNIEGFNVPSSQEWETIIGLSVTSGSFVDDPREGAVVNNTSGNLFSKVVVNLEGTEYEDFALPSGSGFIKGLLIFPDGATIDCPDITACNEKGNRFTSSISYDVFQSLCTGDHACAFLPAAGIYGYDTIDRVYKYLWGDDSTGMYWSRSDSQIGFDSSGIDTNVSFASTTTYTPIRLVKYVE